LSQRAPWVLREFVLTRRSECVFHSPSRAGLYPGVERRSATLQRAALPPSWPARAPSRRFQLLRAELSSEVPSW